MSTIRSRKNKGRKLQQEVRDLLLEKTKGYGFVEGDIESVTMSTGGRDIQLSPSAEKVIPWDIECKNTQTLNAELFL